MAKINNKITKEIAEVLQKSFSSNADDAIKASEHFIKNSDSKVARLLNTGVMNTDELSKMITHDSKFVGNTTNMFDYVGMTSTGGAKTSLLSNADNFKNYLSENSKEANKMMNRLEIVPRGRYDNNKINNRTQRNGRNDGLRVLPGTSIESNIDDLSNASNKIISNSNLQAPQASVIDELSGSASALGGNTTSYPGSFEAPTDTWLNKNKYSSMKNYQMYNANRDMPGARQAFESGNFDDPRLSSVAKAMGKSPQQMSVGDIEAYRSNMLYEARNRNASLSDNLGYHKIPQKAVGAMGTAWLVNKLASDKGQQSNAQLYGQPQYGQSQY